MSDSVSRAVAVMDKALGDLEQVLTATPGVNPLDVLMDRLEGEMPPDRAVELIEAGAEPLRDFIAALHTKLMVEEVERRR